VTGQDLAKSYGGGLMRHLPAAVRIWRKKTGAITITTITTIRRASWAPITTIITIINTQTRYYISARKIPETVNTFSSAGITVICTIHDHNCIISILFFLNVNSTGHGQIYNTPTYFY
jgi:hypothetical protein